MNSDSAFSIGKDHTVCEDYALAGVHNDIAYGIVCDGCSASVDVDFGARVLALSAKETLFNMVYTPLSFLREKPVTVEDFGSHTIKKASEVFKTFPMLNPLTLDTTLLVAWVKDKKLTAYMFGDGVIVHRTKTGIKMEHVHLTSGAPDYLSYSLDKERTAAYNRLKDNRKELWTSHDGIHDYKPFVPVVYESPVEDGDTISVISDGINSFHKSDNTQIDWKDLVDEFTGFKNFEGQFVLRRLLAFKRKTTKENWHHLDDISVASIVV